MSIKKMRKFNDQKFIDDLRSVSKVMVYCSSSELFLRTTKKEVMKEAERNKVRYYISDTLFVVKQNVMVII